MTAHETTLTRMIHYKDMAIPAGGFMAPQGIMPTALGIDIGLRYNGYAIAASRWIPATKTIMVHLAEAGELFFDTPTTKAGRTGKDLHAVRTAIGDIVLTEGWYRSLTAIGIETPITFAKNEGANWRETWEVLGVLRAALCQFAPHAIEYRFHPSAVRSAFRLPAGAKKEEVAARIEQITGFGPIGSTHAMDAAAISLVALWRHALAGKMIEFGGELPKEGSADNAPGADGSADKD